MSNVSNAVSAKQIFAGVAGSGFGMHLYVHNKSDIDEAVKLLNVGCDANTTITTKGREITMTNCLIDEFDSINQYCQVAAQMAGAMDLPLLQWTETVHYM